MNLEFTEARMIEARPDHFWFAGRAIDFLGLEPGMAGQQELRATLENSAMSDVWIRTGEPRFQSFCVLE